MKQLPDDDAIVEFVAELAVALVDADHAKAAALVKGQAGGVLDEDPETSFQKPRSA